MVDYYFNIKDEILAGVGYKEGNKFEVIGENQWFGVGTIVTLEMIEPVGLRFTDGTVSRYLPRNYVSLVKPHTEPVKVHDEEPATLVAPPPSDRLERTFEGLLAWLEYEGLEEKEYNGDYNPYYDQESGDSPTYSVGDKVVVVDSSPFADFVSVGDIATVVEDDGMLITLDNTEWGSVQVCQKHSISPYPASFITRVVEHKTYTVEVKGHIFELTNDEYLDLIYKLENPID